MAFKSSIIYSFVRNRRFKSPIKLVHIWMPLAFLIVCFFRNQNIAALSFIEAGIAVGITLASFLPLFVWASRDELEPPAFQCFCAVHFIYYAYPIISTKPAYMQYPESTRLVAGACVLVFLTLANLIYHVGRRRAAGAGPAAILDYRFLPDKTIAVLFTFLLMSWVSFIVVRHFGLINMGNATNVVSSLATGSGTVAVWTLARQIGERKLALAHTFFIMVLTIFGLSISFATGSLIYGLTILVAAVIAFTLGRGKVPWAIIFLTLGIVCFLNLGKAEMRKVHWRRGPPLLTIGRVFSVYETWIPASWNVLVSGKTREKSDAQSVFERANLIHMLALVVDRTPESIPFLWGETYMHLPILMVPRPLWEKKPHGHISTELLGLRYGVTNRTVARTTTIGFGLLAESWANFGWAGVIGLALVVGAGMRAISMACANAHPSSLHMLLSVVWIAQSFQIEQALSSWVSSFVQCTVAILFVLYPFTVSRHVFTRTSPRTSGPLKYIP